MSSVRKSSPVKSSRSPYVFGSSSQSGESDVSPQKIPSKSFYGSKAKKGYLTPLERKDLREKMSSSTEDETTKKASPRKPVQKRQKVTVKKSTSKSKVTRKTKKATTTKVPAKSPAQRTPQKAKTPKQILPKKSPRRSVPRNKSPLKPMVAKKGISLYLQTHKPKAQSEGKVLFSGKSKKAAIKQEEKDATTKRSSPRKSTPRKSTPRKTTPKKTTPKKAQGE